MAARAALQQGYPQQIEAGGRAMGQVRDKFSKSQIDRLGERLKHGSRSEEDFELLDAYRRSFRMAHEKVVRQIEEHLDLIASGRPAKSNASIVEKLRRETIRLSQVQDIAGCRIVVKNCMEQDDVVRRLRECLCEPTIVDRRTSPSHLYRAVHVVAKSEERLVEIQVRTGLQHRWAELSERLALHFDPAIKYGGGDSTCRTLLTLAYNEVKSVEDEMSAAWSSNNRDRREQLEQTMSEVARFLDECIMAFEKGDGAENGISDAL